MVRFCCLGKLLVGHGSGFLCLRTFFLSFVYFVYNVYTFFLLIQILFTYKKTSYAYTCFVVGDEVRIHCWEDLWWGRSTFVFIIFMSL